MAEHLGDLRCRPRVPLQRRPRARPTWPRHRGHRRRQGTPVRAELRHDRHRRDHHVGGRLPKSRGPPRCGRWRPTGCCPGPAIDRPKNSTIERVVLTNTLPSHPRSRSTRPGCCRSPADRRGPVGGLRRHVGSATSSTARTWPDRPSCRVVLRVPSYVVEDLQTRSYLDGRSANRADPCRPRQVPPDAGTCQSPSCVAPGEPGRRPGRGRQVGAVHADGEEGWVPRS